MAPLSGSLRPLFCCLPRKSTALLISDGRRLRLSALVLATFASLLGPSRGFAQQPSPIPNWTTSTSPGSSAGQYSSNNPSQAYGYARQPYDQAQTEQPPVYEQPPDYPQQYGQAQNAQPQYQQAPDPGTEQAWGIPDQGPAPNYQPQQALSPDRLEQMVAPIALYPDNLISMILAASTYPAEVSSADQWLHAQGGAPAEQIAAGANAQTGWDPSVKALTAFPQVLDTMAQSLQWTTDLGNAYYNQPQDVMQSIQVLRSRAQSAGNLQSTPQQEVVVDQGEIQIAPPTPEVVYVPQYDPWVVYGRPINPYPGFAWVGGGYGSYVGWSSGIYLDAFSALPFGWLGWGLDWYSHAIFFGNDLWCPRGYAGRDWGFAHGGARYWGYHGEMARWRGRGDWGGRGGWEGHTFRSGWDRGRFGNGGSWGHNGSGYGGRNGGSWRHNGGSGWGNRGGNGYGGREGGSWGRNGAGSGNGGNWGHNGGGSGGYGGQGGYGGHNGNGGNGGQGGYGGHGGQGGYGGQNGGQWARNGNNGQNGGYGRGGLAMPRGGSFSNGGAEGRIQNGRGFGFSNSPSGGYGQQGRGSQYGGNRQQGRGSQYGGYGQQSRGSQGWEAYNHGPQPIGRPQQYNGSQSFSQGRQGYGFSAPQHVYGGSYGRQQFGSSGSYGSRPSFGGTYRSPGSGFNNDGRSYGYNGSSGVARMPSNGGGFRGFGGERPSGGYGFGGGGGYRAPKSPSFSSHSWGGGGGSHFGGGGSSFGGRSHFGGSGGHFSGGGSHFGGGGGHFGGGGGGSHFGGGGHSGGGRRR